MSFEKEKWLDPPKKYRVYQMLHEFPAENRTVLMDCLHDYGFGGAVTNPDHDGRRIHAAHVPRGVCVVRLNRLRRGKRKAADKTGSNMPF